MKIGEDVCSNDDANNSYSRRFIVLTLLLLLFIGLGSRIALNAHEGWSIPPVPGTDASEYDMYAWSLAQGLGYSGISPDVVGPDGNTVAHLTAYRSPGTSLYWAGLYRVFGHRYKVVRLSECLMDTITILLVYGIGRKCYGRTVALFAAAIYALWPTALLYTTQLLSETQYTLLFCCFILLSLQFAEKKTWGWALGAGVFLGYDMLIRGNAIFMVALMIPWCLWQFRRTPSVIVRGLAIPLVALLMLIPWTVRNYRLFHAFVPFQTGGGDVLLGSYNRITASDPIYYGYWVYAVASLPEYRNQITGPNNEVIRDRVETHLAIQWLRSHPGTWWYFAESKFRRAWSPFLQPKTPLLYRAGTLISWGPILLLFTVGFLPTAIWSLKTGSPVWLLHLGILHFVITAEVFWGSNRFRYPVEGLIIIIASKTMVWLYEYFKERFLRAGSKQQIHRLAPEISTN